MFGVKLVPQREAATVSGNVRRSKPMSPELGHTWPVRWTPVGWAGEAAPCWALGRLPERVSDVGRLRKSGCGAQE